MLGVQMVAQWAHHWVWKLADDLVVLLAALMVYQMVVLKDSSRAYLLGKLKAVPLAARKVARKVAQLDFRLDFHLVSRLVGQMGSQLDSR